MSGQFGSANPNWKGGRTVATNGYVLIKDRHNPMADVRGYVYEHRLVMAGEIGRSLLTREQVHHDDEVKVNNDPSNLELCASAAEHRYRHRQGPSNRRRPGQPNTRMSCACGCGTEFWQFDVSGRPRSYVTGHNPMSSPTLDAILAALQHGPLSRTQLAASLGRRNVRAVATALSKLKRAGRVHQVAHGVWAMRGAS